MTGKAVSDASFYEELINSLDDLIWSVSADFKLLVANNAFIESMKIFTGLTIRPGDSLVMSDVFQKDYLSSWEDAFHQALKGASLKKEIYTPANSNSPESWTETSFNPIYKHGKVVAVACCSRNITEQKAKEALLVKSEVRLAQAQAVAKVASWETDLVNFNVTWSAETYRIFELDPLDFNSSHPGFLGFVHPDDYEKVDKALTNSMAVGSDNSIEHRIVPRDGVVKWVEERWRIIRNDQNKPVRAIGTCQDITERKNAEEKIKTSSVALQNALNDLNKIMDASLDVICVVDVNGYFKKVSAASEVVFGYKPDELVGKLIFDFVHPEDRDKTVQSANRVMFGNYVPNFTNRYVRKDGSLVDIEWSASWHAGDRVRYGIARDVTEKKRLENAFEIERKRFYDLFLQAPSSMGILIGPDHVFQSVNPLYLQLMRKTDIIGKPVKEVFPEMEGQGFIQLLDDVYKTGEPFKANEMLVQIEGEENPGTIDLYLNFVYQAYRNSAGDIEGVFFFIVDVTEQVLSRKKIEESEKRYRTLFEQNLAGIYQSTLSGKILNCNEALAKMLGYDSPEELINKKAAELYFSSEERDRFINNLRDKRYLNNYEGIIKRKDGRALYYLENVSLNNDSADGADFFDGILLDITDRKLTELALKQSNERFINVTKATFDAIWDWDIGKQELYLGNGFKELFGYEFDDNKTQLLTWANHIHPEDRERVVNSRLNKIVHQNELTWKDDYRYMRADGSIAYVSDRGILLRNDSGTYRMIGAMQDITHLKENEIAITQLNQNLEKHIQKLAESNEELERFAYVASHDLQEPLRMVTSFMQLLKSKYSDQLDATAQKYIHFAVDGASRMKTLIHDLLEISRIGSLPAVHREINTIDVIRKTLAALKRVIDESQAKINVSSLPVVYGNESQLLQLFQNLISNAIKYTANVIPEITISWSETPGEWQFCVADNGIGIDPQSYEKIFIIFQRLHNQKDYSGTGIGLAICKKIIELHGGKIWVESSKGNGSKFYFTISKMQTSPVDSTKLVCSNLANNS
jgi:PAS domain S-box-containing protein